MLPDDIKQRAGVFSFQQQMPPGIKPPQRCASPTTWDYSDPIAVRRILAMKMLYKYTAQGPFQNLARQSSFLPLIYLLN